MCRMSLRLIMCLLCWLPVSVLAQCIIEKPVRQAITTPVSLSLGILEIQLQCNLNTPQALSFPLDIVSHPRVYTPPDVSIVPLSSARAAYLLPSGDYTFTLTLDVVRPRQLPLRIEPVARFQQHNSLHLLTISGFAGLCIALSLYVGILGRSLRNEGFYAYSAYILSAGFFFVLQEGVLKVLFPLATWLHSIGLKLIFAGLTVYTAQRFISRLLEFKLLLRSWEHAIIRYAGIVVLALGGIAAIVPSPLNQFASLLMGSLTIVVMLALVVATVYAMVRKIHCAGLVLIALLLLLAAMAFRVYFPHVSEFLHRYALIVSVTIEAFLLAIAASEKVKRLQIDKITAYMNAASDTLCPVLNRRGWEEAANRLLKQHRKDGGFLVMLFIDMNDFKQINDKYGHNVGDNALIILAKILNAQCRPQDIVGRLGGDEFVIMSHCHSRNIGERMIERIKTRLASLELRIDDINLPVSASIGAQIFDLPHTDLSILLHQTDMLMYEQKQQKLMV
ncbi:diguanylate cyclase domain-containing protein [Alteromonas sp. AMM-1]|uniref:sensor domain-containing diguanylate cyclase n=1 Tax=Alteromonas sp. AMM-1 TaxID=3394233 RepID=UPI0039A48C4C